jgi:hypothetical protein
LTGDACCGVSNVVFQLKLQADCVVLVLLVWCYDRWVMHGVSNVVFRLKLRAVCVVLVLLVWCYD